MKMLHAAIVALLMTFPAHAGMVCTNLGSIMHCTGPGIDESCISAGGGDWLC